MTNISKVQCDRAPCGCPLPARKNARNPPAHSTICPGVQRGSVRQHATDLLVPLLHQHIQYHETLQQQTAQAALSWESASTQLEDAVTDEGYSKYNRGGLNPDCFYPLTPPDGVNMNESRQFMRASFENQALQISPSLHRFFQEEEQDNVDVDQNGVAYYSPRGRPIPMGPAHFQAPTGSNMATMASGKPSTRGKSSSRSGRRSSRDEMSSGYDNNNYFLHTGRRFEEEYERASQVTMSEEFEEDMFPFEEDQWN